MAEYKLEQDYKVLRAKEYLSIGDQLDAIWKIIDILIKDKVISVNKDKSISDVINNIVETKQKFLPKETK